MWPSGWRPSPRSRRISGSAGALPVARRRLSCGATMPEADRFDNLPDGRTERTFPAAGILPATGNGHYRPGGDMRRGIVVVSLTLAGVIIGLIAGARAPVSAQQARPVTPDGDVLPALLVEV